MEGTTTIQLKKRTKERLAHVRDRYHAKSLDEALDRLLTRDELDEAYAVERATRLVEADNADYQAELEAWEGTLADGID